MLLNDFIDLFEREENPTNFLQTFVEVLGPTSSESSQKLQLFLVDERLRNLRGPARKKVADFLHQLITQELEEHPSLRYDTIHALCSLCTSWGVLPTLCMFQGEVKDTISREKPLDEWARLLDERGEGSGVLSPNKRPGIWKSIWGSKVVVVKAIGYLGYHSGELEKELPGMIAPNYLNHEKLLPLHGLCVLDKGTGHDKLCLVSPWMKNGNIRTFLKENPQSNRFPLLLGVCKGLIYLHSKNFVHCGLNIGNVLVDDGKRAVLADSCFTGSGPEFASAYSAEDKGTGGKPIPEEWIYMAPEQLRKLREEAVVAKFDKPVDVYALGVLIIEVLAKEPPALTKAATESLGERPMPFNGDVILELPSSLPNPDDPIWNLARRCLALSPVERPQLEEIRETLEDYYQSDFLFQIPPATTD